MNAEGQHHPLYYSYQNHIKLVEDSLSVGNTMRAVGGMLGTLCLLHPSSHEIPEYIDLTKKLNQVERMRTFNNPAEARKVHDRWYKLLESEGYTSACVIDIVFGGGVR